jgi:hypothetical protein
MMKEATPKRKRLKLKTSDEKKEATPKCNGLKLKTSDEERSNPKTQGAPIKDLR